MSIAQTILAQIGGNAFCMMTGAKNLISLPADDESLGGLGMKIGRNAGSISHVRIKLTPDDLYTVEYLRVRKFEVKVVERVEGLFFDQLGDSFRRVTGMETRMPRIVNL